MSRMLLAAATAAAISASASAAGAVELVINGDFSDGNTGFLSNHTYEPDAGQLTGANLYAVGTNPQFHHPSFASFSDHTGDAAGLMFIANSFSTTVWYETNRPVAENSDYLFSVWIRLAFGDSPPLLSLRINDVQIGGEFTSGLSGSEWVNFTRTWNSGSAESATLAIYNRNGESGGNDFALDDISFTGPEAPAGVPEPATWALMIAGFGAAGAMLRRRRGAPA